MAEMHSKIIHNGIFAILSLSLSLSLSSRVPPLCYGVCHNFINSVFLLAGDGSNCHRPGSSNGDTFPHCSA